MKKKISENQVNQMIRLYQSGVSNNEIARKFGFSHGSAVKYHLKKRGIYVNKTPNKRFFDEEKAIIIEMNKNGSLVIEIAKKLNRRYQTIYHWLKQNNIPYNKAPLSDGKHLKEYWESHHIEKVLPLYQKSVNLYNNHKDWSFQQITDVVYGYCEEKDIIHGFTKLQSTARQITKVKQFIGQYLMLLCSTDDECSFKALMPNYEMEK